MAVEKIAGTNLYQTKSYQSGKEGLTDKVKKEEKEDVSPVAHSNVVDYKPVTFLEKKEKIKNDKDEETEEEERKEAYETDQQALHERIQKTIDDYSSHMGNFDAKFGVHESTNRVMIKLVDKDTKEVIKEIPPEKTLDMIAKCLELAGILVDQKI